MLRDEGIQFQVCRNPDVKYAVVERVHRTIRDRLLKFFTFSFFVPVYRSSAEICQGL
jgi:hypothetical protein